jgi:hypothetical protein
MSSKFSQEDDDLLAELGVEVEKKNVGNRTPEEERIIAGFEEIQRFVEENGQTPTHGEGKDIFERIYAVRLERISWQPDCRKLVEAMDHQGILLPPQGEADPANELDDDELLEALGVETKADESLQTLKHVRPRAEIQAAENIGKRSPCEDFDSYKELFKKVKENLKSKRLVAENFRKNSEISVGEFFIIQGQIAYVQDAEPVFIDGEGREDRRIRVIFDNTTEGVMLRRSLQKRLWEDETGRRIVDPEKSIGPLFSNEASEGDLESGTLYVLRSNSTRTEITKNRELIHKVGFTTGSVERRVADAENQATYLLAKVEIVATYKLYNINANRLERLIHRFLDPAKLDIEIDDRFGKPFKPREWFLVPLGVIKEALQRLQDGSIVDHVYDPAQAMIVKRTNQDPSNNQSG